MTDLASRIAENLARVQTRIADAARASGRQADQVQLVAVTKYVGDEEVRALAAAGCRDFGESRPQQLWQKAEQLADVDCRWHQIGHLQRNKVARTLPLIDLLHSVDSERLLRAVDEAAAGLGRRVPVLLEVNISGEAAKHGLAPEEIAPLLPAAASLAHIEVRGLMAMAHLAGGREQARIDFAQLRELRDCLQADCPEGVALGELSMGMSDDFDLAIREGATIVRVGSALYEGLPR